MNPHALHYLHLNPETRQPFTPLQRALMLPAAVSLLIALCLIYPFGRLASIIFQKMEIPK